MRTTTSADRSGQLAADIERTGYYPAVVRSSIDSSLAGEAVLDYLISHEPTIDHDEVLRHMTVVALTPSRLIIGHTDEHSPDSVVPHPYTSTSTEAIDIEEVTLVSVNRIVIDPASYQGSGAPKVSEAVVTIGWHGVQRVDLEPAPCSDPNCEADHGYIGTVANDDFSLRMTTSVEGQEAVDALLAFGESLSARTRRR